MICFVFVNIVFAYSFLHLLESIHQYPGRKDYSFVLAAAASGQLCVVDGGDTWLTSQLITARVSPALQDQVLRGAVEKGFVAFLVGLTALISARTSVLDTAVSLQDWTLVFKAVKLQNWTLVFEMVKLQNWTLVFEAVKLQNWTLVFEKVKLQNWTLVFEAVKLQNWTLVFETVRLQNWTLVFEAVKLQNWTLVFEAVKLHEELQLSAQQMNAGCRAAVSDRQWDFFLLERGVDPTQEMVDAVLRSGSDVLERLLGIFPRETLPSAVKRMLIEGAIGLDSADILQELLRRYGASDTETMRAFERAVSCRNEEALRALVSCANRNGQLLKRFCATKSDVYPPQDFRWICLALKDRNIVLSLDIGLAFDALVFADILLHNETSRKVRRMFLQKVCTRDKESLFEKIANQLIVRYPNYRRTLFLMAVRQGYHSLVSKLYGNGVSVSDVRYALRVSFDQPNLGVNYFNGGVWDFIGKLKREDSSTLLKGFVRESVEYFVSTGRERKFLEWFTLYCEWKEAEARFVVNVFRRAYKTAVVWERVNCFVESVSLVTNFLLSKFDLQYMSRDYTSKAVAAFDFAVKKQKFRFVSQIILATEISELYGFVLKRLFRKGVWPVFDLLFDFENLSQDPGFIFLPFFSRVDGYMEEFMHCLSKTVVKASETLTAGISDISTPGATEKVSVEAVCVLDKWLHCLCPYSNWEGHEVLTGKLGRYLRHSQRSGAVLRLAEFSSGHGCHSLALLLAAVLGPDGRELMQRTVTSHLHSVEHNLIYNLAEYALQSLRKPARFAFLIKNIHMSVLISDTDMEDVIEQLCPPERAVSRKVIAALRRRKAYPWVLVCQVVLGDFVEAEKTLTLCNSQESECVHVVLTYAAQFLRWDLVSKYVSEACRPDLLRELLNLVLGSRSTADVSLVRRLVNLVGTSHDVKNQLPLLNYVVFRVPLEKRLRALDIARCLVSLGVSAQQRKEELKDISLCPLREASVCRELQLVKLFHRSGVCSNRRLFEVAYVSQHPGFFPEENSDVTKETIHSYLTFAASCPLSLQDLCRHTVSECLGGQPGYLRRVQALPVPEPVKEFVLFSDLVQDESGGQTGE